MWHWQRAGTGRGGSKWRFFQRWWWGVLWDRYTEGYQKGREFNRPAWDVNLSLRRAPPHLCTWNSHGNPTASHWNAWFLQSGGTCTCVCPSSHFYVCVCVHACARLGKKFLHRGFWRLFISVRRALRSIMAELWRNFTCSSQRESCGFAAVRTDTNTN